MTQAKIHRMHTPVYCETKYPPLPPRIRLAANCWERVWWLTLQQPIESPQDLDSLSKRFSNDSVTVRAQMRTQRRICFAITSQELTDQTDFEVAMTIMASINQEMVPIDRVEDRPVDMWPISDFQA